jgi:endonuclease YncB( thermonuclease family)
MHDWPTIRGFVVVHLESMIMVFGKQVTVEYQDKDRYGRTLGKIQDINLEQVEDELAWHYKHYQSNQAPSVR